MTVFWPRDSFFFKNCFLKKKRSVPIERARGYWSIGACHTWRERYTCAHHSYLRDHVYDNLSSPSSATFDDTTPIGAEALVFTDPVERERQMQEWKDELEKVEGEINMLRQVLGSKVRRATELKRNLGITPFQEFKQDLQTGIKQIKDSNTYQKTNETLHDLNEKITHTSAYQKTSAVMKTATEKTSSAFSTVGAAVSKKLGDIKNSQTFKSVEEKVETAYASVKSKVTGSKSTDEIDSAFKDATSDKTSEPGSPTTASGSSSPKENVPL